VARANESLAVISDNPAGGDPMYLMVLDDKETYSGLYGCAIVQVPSNFSAEQIEELLEKIRHGGAALEEKHVITEFN